MHIFPLEILFFSAMYSKVSFNILDMKVSK
jgi:hypothetical protein